MPGCLWRSRAGNSRVLPMFGSEIPNRIQTIRAEEEYRAGRCAALSALPSAPSNVSGGPATGKTTSGNTRQQSRHARDARSGDDQHRCRWDREPQRDHAERSRDCGERENELDIRQLGDFPGLSASCSTGPHVIPGPQAIRAQHERCRTCLPAATRFSAWNRQRTARRKYCRYA